MSCSFEESSKKPMMRLPSFAKAECPRKHEDPKSQQDIGRSNNKDNADWMIRAVAAKLLDVECSETENNNDGIDKIDAAKAARTVASRLCVPRDMGAPAAAVLRYELSKTASDLEK